MQQRRKLGCRAEVAGLPEESEIGDEGCGGADVPAKGAELPLQHEEPAGDCASDQHDDQRRKDSTRPTCVEIKEAEAALLHRPVDDAGNQKAGNNEKNVDPDKAAGKLLWEGMEAD